MKKLFCILIVVLALVSFAACGSKKDKATTDNQTSNSSVSQNQATEKASESAPTTSAPAQSTDGIDVDLTKLSSTMVYSEVYNMMYTPDDYIGKTVKMNGHLHITRTPKQRSLILCLHHCRRDGLLLTGIGVCSDRRVHLSGRLSGAKRRDNSHRNL